MNEPLERRRGEAVRVREFRTVFRLVAVQLLLSIALLAAYGGVLLSAASRGSRLDMANHRLAQQIRETQIGNRDLLVELRRVIEVEDLSHRCRNEDAHGVILHTLQELAHEAGLAAPDVNFKGIPPPPHCP